MSHRCTPVWSWPSPHCSLAPLLHLDLAPGLPTAAAKIALGCLQPASPSSRWSLPLCSETTAPQVSLGWLLGCLALLSVGELLVGALGPSFVLRIAQRSVVDVGSVRGGATALGYLAGRAARRTVGRSAARVVLPWDGGVTDAWTSSDPANPAVTWTAALVGLFLAMRTSDSRYERKLRSVIGCEHKIGRKEMKTSTLAMVCSIELFERLAYFVFLTHFVSFLSQSGQVSTTEAVQTYGSLMMAVCTGPILGGWVADRWLTVRRAARVGLFLLMSSYGLLLRCRARSWRRCAC